MEAILSGLQSQNDALTALANIAIETAKASNRK
jgi:hypothetical protein